MYGAEVLGMNAIFIASDAWPFLCQSASNGDCWRISHSAYALMARSRNASAKQKLQLSTADAW